MSPKTKFPARSQVVGHGVTCRSGYVDLHEQGIQLAATCEAKPRKAQHMMPIDAIWRVCRSSCMALRVGGSRTEFGPGSLTGGPWKLGW